MWSLPARTLDRLVAWQLRRSLFRRQSHRTDPDSLRLLIDSSQATDATDLFPPPPDIDESQLTEHNHTTRWGGDEVEFLMPSAWETPIPENQTIWGRAILPRPSGWASPIVLVIHPWIGPGINTMLRRHGRALIRQGIGVVAPVLPHHFQRRAEGSWNGERSICGDMVEVVNTARQSIADVQRVTAWLRSRGATRVGVTGVSLGGGVAALLACLDPNLVCVAAVVPPGEASLALRSSALTDGPIRRDLDASGLSEDLFEAACDLVSPQRFTPVIPRDRLLIVGALHDQIIPPSAYPRLAERWGCELWSEPHSHTSLFLAGGLRRRLSAWIAERMLKD